MLLYFTGSMIMNEPTEECVTDFWIKGSLIKLPVESSNPRFIAAAALLRESCNDKKLCKTMLVEDYHWLFDVKASPLAPAYESLYINKNGNHRGINERAGDFYSSYGWEHEPGKETPDDHLGIELLFLTRLVDNYLHIDDDPCRREMEKEIRRFIDQHLLSWIPEWNQKIQESAHTLCYKGIGNLIYACLEDIHSILV